MPSTLIVFYSYTGTSRRAAQLLAAQQGWPLGEIVEERPRSGALGSLRCVLDSVFGLRPAVRYKGPDLADFDRVVLVAPVWMLQLAGPMRSFVARFGPQLRHYAVITTMGSRGAANAEGEIARILSAPALLSTAFLARSVEDGSYAAALQAFGDALSSATSVEPVRPAEYSAGTA